jgi:hypothetical protein
MNLAQRDQRPEGICSAVELRSTGQPRAAVPTWVFSSANGSDLWQKRSAVALDGGVEIVFGETEIEIAFAVGPGESAHSRGKTMHQPGDLVQVTSAKNR